MPVHRLLYILLKMACDPGHELKTSAAVFITLKAATATSPLTGFSALASPLHLPTHPTIVADIELLSSMVDVLGSQPHAKVFSLWDIHLLILPCHGPSS